MKLSELEQTTILETLDKLDVRQPNDLKEIAKKLKPFLPDSVIKVKSAEFGEEVV